MNLYDLASFSIVKAFRLVIIFASLGHNHFVYQWLRKIDIKYVSGTILMFSMVLQKLLVGITRQGFVRIVQYHFGQRFLKAFEVEEAQRTEA